MCEARIPGTFTACNKHATMRIGKDDKFICCVECFRRYNLKKDWHGWFDDFAPGQVIPKPKSVQKPVDGCATCWRKGEKVACRSCAVELCNTCKSVPPPGYTGIFCKKCVPRLCKMCKSVQPPGYTGIFCEKCVPVKAAVPVPVDPIDSLVEQFTLLNLNMPLTQLQEKRKELIAWMKGKSPRILHPYYKHRIELEAAIKLKSAPSSS